MKFLIILTLTILAVATAAPADQKQQQKQHVSGAQKQVEAQVQGRAHTQSDKQQHHSQVEGKSNIEQSGVEGREIDMDMGLDRSKKSYGKAKCGKAVVVGCGPIVQKVKCKGHGGHAGAYTEPIPQYANPEYEYQNGPFIQYV